VTDENGQSWCESCGLEVHAPVMLGGELIPYAEYRKRRRAIIDDEVERLMQEKTALDEFEAPRLRCVVAACPAPSLVRSRLCKVHRDDYAAFMNKERVRRCRQRKQAQA
jgi:hypothetical protein